MVPTHGGRPAYPWSSGNSQLIGLPIDRSTDLRGDTTLLTELYQVTAGVLIQKL
jgi:hypothetical protein